MPTLRGHDDHAGCPAVLADLCQNRETHAYGINKVGLERRGFDRERLRHIQHAYRLLLAGKIEYLAGDCEVERGRYCVGRCGLPCWLIEKSERGVLK